MKKVLFISPFFAPENEIAAIRTTKLAKYISLDGYDVTVICKRQRFSIVDSMLAKDSEFVRRIVRLECPKIICSIYSLIFRRPYYQESKAKKTSEVISKTGNSDASVKPQKFKAAIADVLYRFFGQMDELNFARKAKKLIRNEAIHYDIVFSTFGPRSSHIISAYIKQRKYAGKWIADFRDNIKLNDSKYTARDIRFLDLVKHNADEITVVSESMMPYYQSLDKLTVLTNGFDPDDIPQTMSYKKNEKLTFAYVGNMYSGKSDLSTVFRALHQLSSEGLISLDRIGVSYAGNDIICFQSQAKLYDCQRIIRNYGFISRTASIELQNKSDVLLLASWNKVGSTGIITGKFYEYLLMKKPIVCTITGDLPDSILKKIIEESNVGCCWEEAAGESDYQSLKDYILQIYTAYINNEKVLFHPNETFITKYDYRSVARKLEVIMEGLLRE